MGLPLALGCSDRWLRKKRWIARNIAAALLGGVWTPRAAKARVEKVIGPASRKMRCGLVDDVFAAYPQVHLTSPAALAKFVLESRRFDQLNAVMVRKARPVRAVLASPRFAPGPEWAHLRVPNIATPGELIEWLGLAAHELDWFADERRQNAHAKSDRLLHYTYRFVPKASGPPRLIEEPKPRLKAIQRRILGEILNHVPVHECAHGFVGGRSALTAAQLHAGEQVVLAFDLQNFFLSTNLVAVHHVFRKIGYPWAVARALTGLCSGSVPAGVFQSLPPKKRHDVRVRRRFDAPHLPQGSPTSPALANLAALRLDARLQGLANSFGANYTRYADDLTFSGETSFERGLKLFQSGIETIVTDEGFAINARKTRVMRRSDRQQVLGLVVNEGLNISRLTFDELKATLHNCRQSGWRAQNHAALPDFRAHLDGRITWVETVNAARGRKLRQAFQEIDWA